jgi:soluble P-type ATPase
VIRLPAEEDVFVAVLDIDGESVDGIISQLTTAGAHVVVFGDDPNDMQQIRFRALGVVAVLPKQEIFDDLAEHIPMIV